SRRPSRYETRAPGFLLRIGIVFSIASIASITAAPGKKVVWDLGSQSLAGRLRRTAGKSSSQAMGRVGARSGACHRLLREGPRASAALGVLRLDEIDLTHSSGIRSYPV